MSWRKVKLGELVNNFSVRAKDIGGAGDLNFFGVSNEFGIIKTKYSAEDKADDYKIIEAGCFAYNPYRVNVGSIGLFDEDFKGLISPAYVVFKPKPNGIIPELLLKFLKSDEGLRQIIFFARGTVRQALRFDDLCNIELSIPNYNEQQKFFNKLIISQNKSDILNKELNYQLSLVKQLRQQFLQDAVQGKLVEQNHKDEPASELLKRIKAEKLKLIAEKKLKKEKELPPIKKEEIPFEIPEGWIWCRLGEILSFGPSNGFSPKESKLGIGIKCLTLTATTSGVFKEQFYKLVDEQIPHNSYLWLESGDILIQRGNSIDYVGIAALYEGESHNFIFPDLMIKIRLPELINTKFIHQVLISPLTRKYYADKAFGAQKSMPKINQPVVLNTLIPLPPLSEQNRIVQKLEGLMQKCNSLEESIKLSASQNEKLLQQVLREALRKEVS